ncbi:alpha-L-fucosidase [Parapedobacter sp.]
MMISQKESFLIGCLNMAFLLCVHAQTSTIVPQNTIKIDATDSKETIIEKAAHVVPSTNQLKALQNEFIAFIHFGPNTFTRMEWGNGKEDPKIFDLKTLDTDQWCRTLKAAGMKMVILTVKHHDGFVLWQSRYTTHGIMSTPFRDGKGDVLRDLSASCQKYGLKLGVYLSPADLYQIENPEGLYGNLSKYTKRVIPREVPGRPFANKTTFEFEVDDYNEYFLNQLFEILTEYGPVHEVWFDGAHPKTKGGQRYNYGAWKELIRTLAPEAVIFGREDIRWCGNESGRTRDTEWNVIPYPDNPDTTSLFPDMQGEDLGSRDKLYQARYLHYQQAETNTSIREGWFYRDDTHQKVRNADDVFDIYERSVGGNSTFLLNVPPNRDGKFSAADVDALIETGKRINETYGTNLLDRAEGPRQVLDNKLDTYLLLSGDAREIVISTPAPITTNRLMLQEAIGTHSERVEKFAVDAWVGNQWKEIALATNIGYKRILRFADVTTDKLRVRVLESRLDPAISHVSAHFYKAHPPQLAFTRGRDGTVSIAPKQADFNWKPHGENAAGNLNAGFEIFYTLDGTTPNHTSQKYEGPFKATRGELKAISIHHDEVSPVHSERLGIVKENWAVRAVSSERKNHGAPLAIDADPRTFWQSENDEAPHFIAIDLGAEYTVNGMAYTPQTAHSEGMMAKGIIQASADGRTWKTVEAFEFGNLINDPTERTHYFKKPIVTRYIRVESLEIAGKGEAVAISELDFL